MSELLALPKSRPFFVAANPDHEDFKMVNAYEGKLCLFGSSPKLVVYSNRIRP